MSRVDGDQRSRVMRKIIRDENSRVRGLLGRAMPFSSQALDCLMLAAGMPLQCLAQKPDKSGHAWGLPVPSECQYGERVGPQVRRTRPKGCVNRFWRLGWVPLGQRDPPQARAPASRPSSFPRVVAHPGGHEALRKRGRQPPASGRGEAHDCAGAGKGGRDRGGRLPGAPPGKATLTPPKTCVDRAGRDRSKKAVKTGYGARGDSAGGLTGGFVPPATTPDSRTSLRCTHPKPQWGYKFILDKSAPGRSDRHDLPLRDDEGVNSVL